jgi:hypothetical protein
MEPFWLRASLEKVDAGFSKKRCQDKKQRRCPYDLARHWVSSGERTPLKPVDLARTHPAAR